MCFRWCQCTHTSYEDVIAVLWDRFSDPDIYMDHLVVFDTVTRKSDETTQTFAVHVKDLATAAYPTIETAARDTEVQYRFNKGHSQEIQKLLTLCSIPGGSYPNSFKVGLI